MPPVYSKRDMLDSSHGHSFMTARSAMRHTEQIRAAAEQFNDGKRFINPASSSLTRRGVDGSDNMLNLMTLLLALVFGALILITLFCILYRRKRMQRLRGAALPAYEDVKQTSGDGVTFETKRGGHSSIYYIGRDGQPMLQNPRSPPHSADNAPEIHITFPDEHDENGRPQGARVLVVRVGDNATVGLEPMKEEQLPAYEKEAKGQFHSIDMDQIGGLKEKDRTVFQ